MQLELLTQRPESNPRPTPILFVHGLWQGAWCWEQYFMPYFAQKGYVNHALSLRGHAGSEGRKRLRRTSIYHYVDDVAQIVEQLQTTPILIGHSMGGLVVQKYLETHQSPAAVLLASVPTHGAIGATLRLAWRHPLAFVKVNLTLRLYPVVATPEIAYDNLFAKDTPREHAQAFYNKWQDGSYRAFLDMLLFALPRPRRIKTEMLVLGAAEDALFPPKEVESTARAYDAEIEIFDNMGHEMILEIGWQYVADRIIGWLKERAL